jgi:predicted ATPase
VGDAVRRLRLVPVMFESSARSHPPRDVYRAYLAQSQIFVGVYWQSYGWVQPGDEVSGQEDEYRLAAGLPKLLYVKWPANDRQVRLTEMLDRVKADDDVSYQRFSTPDELQQLVETDLAVLLSERFEMAGPPQEPEAHPAVLPVPPTPLVGRDGAVEAVEGLVVREDVRLITLTGPGGVGKSRLALALAARTGRHFDDGARFIELASVTAPELVASAVSARLGLSPSGANPADAVKAYLRSRQLLLVLDNFEQVIGAALLVADLLSACPGVTVMVTSRTTLNLRGEHEYSVPTLGVPDQRAIHDLADVSGFESVRLFVERAQAASEAFELTIDNAAAVAEICRRLDGLPLAIELAAAKVRMFAPQALLARLDHPLALLTGGARDLPERQRTLRTTLDWSFDLLAPGEQKLLARLGVFVGGFDLPAAAAVGGLADDDPDSADEAEESLSSLTESSLVRQAERDGEPRFQMLETIREYALERLNQGEEWEQAHDCHAAHFLTLARRAAPNLAGPGLVAGLERLDVEHANLTATMSWLIGREEYESALILGAEPWQFWSFQGHAEEWAGYGEQILTRSERLPTAQLATGLAITGLMRFFSGQPARARELFERSRTLPREDQDPLVMAYVACVLGCLLTLSREYDRARALVEESRSLQEQVGDEIYMPFTNNVLGRILLSQNDVAGAAALFSEGLSGSRRVSDRYCELLSLYDLSLSSQVQGDRVAAADHLEAGVLLSLRLDEVVSWSARTPSARQAGAAYFIDRLAVVVGVQQDLERSVRLHAAARRLLQTSEGGWLQANPLLAAPDDDVLAALRARLGDPAFNEAWEQGAAIEPGTVARYALQQKRLAFPRS